MKKVVFNLNATGVAEGEFHATLNEKGGIDLTYVTWFDWKTGDEITTEGDTSDYEVHDFTIIIQPNNTIISRSHGWYTLENEGAINDIAEFALKDYPDDTTIKSVFAWFDEESNILEQYIAEKEQRLFEAKPVKTNEEESCFAL